jgi:hypothetical protein
VRLPFIYNIASTLPHVHVGLVNESITYLAPEKRKHHVILARACAFSFRSNRVVHISRPQRVKELDNQQDFILQLHNLEASFPGCVEQTILVIGLFSLPGAYKQISVNLNG